MSPAVIRQRGALALASLLFNTGRLRVILREIDECRRGRCLPGAGPRSAAEIARHEAILTKAEVVMLELAFHASAGDPRN